MLVMSRRGPHHGLSGPRRLVNVSSRLQRPRDDCRRSPAGRRPHTSIEDFPPRLSLLRAMTSANHCIALRLAIVGLACTLASCDGSSSAHTPRYSPPSHRPRCFSSRTPTAECWSPTWRAPATSSSTRTASDGPLHCRPSPAPARQPRDGGLRGELGILRLRLRPAERHPRDQKGRRDDRDGGRSARPGLRRRHRHAHVQGAQALRPSRLLRQRALRPRTALP